MLSIQSALTATTRDLPDIIRAAATSALGVVSLIVCVLAILLLNLFRKDDVRVRISMFALVLVSFVGFGAAVLHEAGQQVPLVSPINRGVDPSAGQAVTLSPASDASNKPVGRLPDAAKTHATIACANSDGSSPDVSSLQAWWPAEGNTADLGPHKLPALNSVGVQYVPGVTGEAFSFDGNASYLQLDDANGMFSLPREFTIAFWLKAAVDQSQKEEIFVLVDRDHGMNTDRGWVIQGSSGPSDIANSDSGALGFFVGVQGAKAGDTTFATSIYPHRITDGRWHHVVGVFRFGRARLFVDGVEGEDNVPFAPATAVPPTTNRRGFSFGRWTSAGRFFKGQLDDIAFFDRALDTAELLQLRRTGERCLKADADNAQH
jgi:hypothetical protein